jgi:hypothetical protein
MLNNKVFLFSMLATTFISETTVNAADQPDQMVQRRGDYRTHASSAVIARAGDLQVAFDVMDGQQENFDRMRMDVIKKLTNSIETLYAKQIPILETSEERARKLVAEAQCGVKKSIDEEKKWREEVKATTRDGFLILGTCLWSETSTSSVSYESKYRDAYLRIDSVNLKDAASAVDICISLREQLAAGISEITKRIGEVTSDVGKPMSREAVTGWSQVLTLVTDQGIQAPALLH